MQNFHNIPDDETLADSRPLLLENDRTIMSCNAGTAFPTENIEQGMLCFRSNAPTAAGGLYELVDLTPTWKLLRDFSKTPLHKEEADNFYARLENNLSDISDKQAARDNLGLGSVATKNTGTAAGDIPVLNASGKIDAALLDVADRVAKAGDTMTGELAAPSIKSSTGSAAATGFKLANNTDLSAIFVKKAGDTLTGELTGTTFKSGGTAAATGFKLANNADLASIFNKGFKRVDATRNLAVSGSGNFYTYVYTLEEGTDAEGIRLTQQQVKYSVGYCSYCHYCNYCSYCNCNCNCTCDCA